MNAKLVASALRQLADALEAQNEPRAAAAAPPTGDLSVVELAARFKRNPSTIRGWLEAGRFVDCYKLNGHDWRVPVAGVEAFEAQQRSSPRAPGVDLGAWRRKRRADGA